MKTESPKQACAEIIWDGPYRMTCSYMIVGGRCIRHGKDGLKYDIATPDPKEHA